MSFNTAEIETWAREHPAETAIGAGIVVIALVAAAKAKGATGGGPTGIPVASAAQGSVSPLGSGGLVGGGGYGSPTTPYNPYQQQQQIQAQAQQNSFLSSLILPFSQGLAKDLFGPAAPSTTPASAPAPSALSGSYSAPAPSVATTPAGVPVYSGSPQQQPSALSGQLSQPSVQAQENSPQIEELPDDDGTYEA